MLTRLVPSVVFGLAAMLLSAASLPSTASAEEADGAKPLVFRKVTEDDRKDLEKAGLAIGDYIIVADAVKQLYKVHTLEMKLNEIKYFDWSQPRWTKKNAELTMRQLLNIHIDQASKWYAGTRKRGRGVLARRQEKYTDAELGDQDLGESLMCLVMGTMWGVPLEVGQEVRINGIIQQRLDLIAAKEKEREKEDKEKE